MSKLYPEVEPYEKGLLDVGDGHHLYWETSGNPHGKPAVVLHGGPGAPCGPRHRRLFDPVRYRIVLLHQRNCGLSTPHASAPDVDLGTNTTRHLVEDLERLRVALGIERWLILGGSWGSTLGLAYAEQHPAAVTELILYSVFLGLRSEIDWVFRGGLGARRERQWNRLRDSVHATRDTDVVSAAHALLFDTDEDVRRRAAYEWCIWESSILEDGASSEVLHPLCKDEAGSLALARIVTHYAAHDIWLEDGALLEGAPVLAEIPMVLINGTRDPQTGRSIPELAKRVPEARVVWVEDAGHSAREDGFTAQLVATTDRFAAARGHG